MASTIRDVSVLSGVSTATVSRTFAKPDSVKAATREKVMEAARLLNYQPNAIARSMALQTTEKIAFLICKKESSILDEFYAGICEGIMKETKNSDYQLLISTAADWETGKRNQVDGLILGGDATLDLISSYRNQGVRIVLVNNEVDGLAFPRVVSDEEAGVRMLVEHLIDRGHKKIAMLAGRFSPYICEQRFQAFRKVMKAHGLPIPEGYVQITDPDYKSAEQAAAKMLLQENPPTAIFGANDEIAVGIMKAAIRLGLRIPEDIAVAGYDDSNVCRALEPEMTSVHTCRGRMGKAAAGLLLRGLQGEDLSDRKIVIPPELVIRNST